jgi:hypothetical protein
MPRRHRLQGEVSEAVRVPPVELHDLRRGVFRNDPVAVAEVFADLIAGPMAGAFTRVVFAIYDRSKPLRDDRLHVGRRGRARRAPVAGEGGFGAAGAGDGAVGSGEGAAAAADGVVMGAIGSSDLSRRTIAEIVTGPFQIHPVLTRE